MKRIKGIPAPAPFIIGLILSILASSFYYYMGEKKLIFIEALDRQIHDAMFRMRGEEKPSGNVVIVDIDEKSLKDLGQWPWPRDLLALLVDRITGSGAVSIGLDMVFPEQDRMSPSFYYKNLFSRMPESIRNNIQVFSDAPEFNFDAKFGASLAASPSCLGYVFTFNKNKTAANFPFPSASIHISPGNITFDDLALIKASGAILNNPDISLSQTEGFINVAPDTGGVIHSVPLLMMMDRIPYPSIALETVRTGLGVPDITIHASGSQIMGKNAILGVSISGRFIPTDNEGRITLNYRGKPGIFQSVSASNIINGTRLSELDKKNVLIGTTAAGLHDMRSTPFSGSTPGVEIQANIADNIISGDPFSHDRLAEIAMTYILVITGGSAMGFILSYSGAIASAAVGIVTLGIIIAGDYYFYFMQKKLVGIVYPVLSIGFIFIVILLFRYFFQDREKKFIYRAFSRYVSPDIVNQLVLHPERLALHGEQRNVTIFFSDIRNFTGISESMKSSDLARLLNSYLTEMSSIIIKHGGLVDKYIGDAIMAIWGAPLEDRHHAANAIRCALDMKKALEQLSEKWRESGLPLVKAGAGINTGDVNAGNFGSELKFQYTVIGDDVNLASRIESLNKNYGTDILVSENTMKAAGDRFFFRYIDKVRVKGKGNAIKIFEPVCEGLPERNIIDEVAAFEAAVHFYINRNFRESAGIIIGLNEKRPGRLYSVYLERIKYFMSEPPPANWDGVHVFSEK